MNAVANGTAHALAHGQANARCAKSVHAKRREEKRRDLKAPDLKAPDLNFEGSSRSFSSPDVTRETATRTNAEISHLDFKGAPALPCEVYENCAEESALLVREIECPVCGEAAGMLFGACRPCWEWVEPHGLVCPRHNGRVARDDVWRVVQVLR